MVRRVQKRGHCQLITGSYYRVVIVGTYSHVTIKSLI